MAKKYSSFTIASKNEISKKKISWLFWLVQFFCMMITNCKQYSEFIFVHSNKLKKKSSPRTPLQNPKKKIRHEGVINNFVETKHNLMIHFGFWRGVWGGTLFFWISYFFAIAYSINILKYDTVWGVQCFNAHISTTVSTHTHTHTLQVPRAWAFEE